jgi:hypothetical protein
MEDSIYINAPSIGGRYMRRPNALYAVAILSVLIVVGGFLGYTMMGQPQPSDSNSPAPSSSATPAPGVTNTPFIDNSTPDGSPSDTSDPSSLVTATTPEDARDAAMAYMQQNHFEIAPLIPTITTWTSQVVSTGLVGSSESAFYCEGWVVTVDNPVVVNPTYTVWANYTDGTISWAGIYMNGVIQETFYFNSVYSLAGLPEQARDAVIGYIQVHHLETAQLMVDLQWAGGAQENGQVGVATYNYFSSGWTVNVQYPNVANPTCIVDASYASGSASVHWTGSYLTGVVSETSYLALLPTPTPSPTPTPKPTATPTPTGAPSPTPTRFPSPTPPLRTPTPPPTPSPNQIRLQIVNATVAYIKASHPEIPNPPLFLSWQPTQQPGTNVYVFTSGSWNATLRPSITSGYTITVNYRGGTPVHLMVAWAGTYTGTWPTGVFAETSYAYTP